MYCPDCGHNNPEGNRFCGMCGESLPERRPDHKNSGERQRERVAQHDPEPVAASLRHREPKDEPVRAREEPRTLSSMEYAATPTEPAGATVSGPSFLGLSSTNESAPGYSYLYEDEQPKSHAGVVVFLLVLAVLGGVLYYEWQPLRSWVVNKSQQKVDIGVPAPTQTPAGSSTASSDNVAGSTAAQPTDQPATPQNDAATPDDSTAPKKAAPAGNAKPDQTAAPKDDDQSQASEPPKTTKEADSKKVVAETKKAKEPKASAAREERAAAARPEGEELVSAGERYLYGHGAAQNCQQAVVNFNAAAKEDNPRAMAHLGALYATGECVPLNRVVAYRWFSHALAQDRNNTYLEHNISMLWREMDQQEKAQVSGEAKEARNRMF